MVKMQFMDKKHFGSKVTSGFSELIFKAIESNKKEDIEKLIEYIIVIESYHFPIAYSMKKDALGKLIAKATFTDLKKDVEALKKYIDVDKAEDYVDYLRQENRGLKKLISRIHEINKTSMQTKQKLEDFDLDTLNLYRGFANEVNAAFLYGKYPGKLFFNAYWVENTFVEESKKPYWIMGLSNLLLDDMNTNIFVDEDSEINRKKRRSANDHTIKNHLENIFALDVDKLMKENAEQYDKLCDIIESIKYKTGKIKDSSVRSDDSNKHKQLSDSAHAERKEKSFHFFKMFGTYSAAASVQKNSGSKQSTWNKKGRPLDLFDTSGNNILPMISPQFTLYQKAIATFIYELKQALIKDSSNQISEYDKAEYNCMKWYLWFTQSIEYEYIDHWNTDLIDFLSKHHPIFTLQHIEPSKTENNLFSCLLLELLKMKLQNDLYSMEYIVQNSKVVMKPLDHQKKQLYNYFKWSMQNFHISETGLDAHTLCLSYAELYELIRDSICGFMLQILPSNVKLESVFHKAKLLMQIIIHPWLDKIPLFQFIALMQCCADSTESSLTIQHYGMPRGKKEVTLQTIMNRPYDNRFKEVRLFLIYLVQRRNLLNETTVDVVDLIEKYVRYQRKSVYDSIQDIKCWKDISDNFNIRNEFPEKFILP